MKQVIYTKCMQSITVLLAVLILSLAIFTIGCSDNPVNTPVQTSDILFQSDSLNVLGLQSQNLGLMNLTNIDSVNISFEYNVNSTPNYYVITKDTGKFSSMLYFRILSYGTTQMNENIKVDEACKTSGTFGHLSQSDMVIRKLKIKKI
jgi:hypothetical protein